MIELILLHRAGLNYQLECSTNWVDFSPWSSW